MILIVMGVSGSGKTTVGKLLAERFGYEFVDADAYHPASNLSKMKAGQALTDADRQPWLQKLREVFSEKDRMVIACSALKQAYRDTLAENADVEFIYLKCEPEITRRRLEDRSGHFMNPDLLASQFDALEEPVDAIEVDASATAENIVRMISTRLEGIV